MIEPGTGFIAIEYAVIATEKEVSYICDDSIDLKTMFHEEPSFKIQLYSITVFVIIHKPRSGQGNEQGLGILKSHQREETFYTTAEKERNAMRFNAR